MIRLRAFGASAGLAVCAVLRETELPTGKDALSVILMEKP